MRAEVVTLAILTVLLGSLVLAGWWLLFVDPSPRRSGRLARLTGRDRPPEEPDPFEVLRVQTRLGAVAEEVRALEMQTTHYYAPARRLVAAFAAYDQLLEEACHLAGVPEPPPWEGEASADRRWYAEQRLIERGWSW